jgi:hypothetical protein
MPTICRFYGILIQMYYDDHNPPHFHAVYGEYKVVISIQDLAILEGDLPPKEGHRPCNGVGKNSQ